MSRPLRSFVQHSLERFDGTRIEHKLKDPIFSPFFHPILGVSYKNVDLQNENEREGERVIRLRLTYQATMNIFLFLSLLGMKIERKEGGQTIP